MNIEIFVIYFLLFGGHFKKNQKIRWRENFWVSFDGYASVNSVRIIIQDTSFSAFNGFICYKTFRNL